MPGRQSDRSELRGWCSELGIPEPPEFPRANAQVMRIGEEVFSSWQPQCSPYDLDELLSDAWIHAKDGDWLIGVAGHGTSSWALHWLQRSDPLLLVMQIGLGGAFADDQSDREAVEGAWELAQRLNQVLADLPADTVADRMLLVRDSDLAGGAIAWAARGSAWDSIRWNNDGMAALAALAELEPLVPGAGLPAS
jgi:hypothetical protein